MSTQSTQPFSDVSQPGANLEQLVASLHAGTRDTSHPIDLALVRLFARCHMNKRYVTVATYPDRVLATALDHDVLAISQSTKSTGCEIIIPAMDGMNHIHVRVYFDPTEDSVFAENASNHAVLHIQSITTARIKRVEPRQFNRLAPGVWSLISFPSVGPAKSREPTILLDLYLKARISWPTSSPSAERSNSKRPQERPEGAKRRKASKEDHSRVQTSVASHPLLEVNDGQTLQISGQRRDDNYHLTRHQYLASTASASLYTAAYSLRPGQVVVTKARTVGHGARTTAKSWEREVDTHQGVDGHPQILRLFGSDARAFTLYMEHIDSPNLGAYIDNFNMCTCSFSAFTILVDVADALQHVHASRFVHNDIKPSNILYHPARGAILIDFGLGGPATEVNHGGSPWYVPPEYLTKKRRGPQGDIFALGVTMLWVLQKCSLPDKNEEWMICNIHNGGPNIQGKASLTMQKWLMQLEGMRNRLSSSERHIESVVRSMLRTEDRISTDELVNSLKLVLP